MSEQRKSLMHRVVHSKSFNVIIVVTVMGIPLLYAAMLTVAYINPMKNVDHMQAQVVNLDKGAQGQGFGDPGKTINFGDELTDRLVHPKDGEDVGFDWREATSEASARQALKDGSARAILVIEDGASQALATLDGPDAAQAAGAKIELLTDDGVSYLAGTMGSTVGVELEKQVRQRANEEIGKALISAMGTVREGLVDASEGAGQLRDGANTLDDGLNQLLAGSRQLSGGMGALQDGSARLADGSRQAAAGAGELAANTGKLAAGMGQLEQGLGQLDQAGQALPGATGKLDGGAQELAEGAQKLSAATGQLKTQVDGAATKLRPLMEAMGKMGANLEGQKEQLGKLDEGSGKFAQFLTGYSALAGGMQKICAGTEGVNLPTLPPIAERFLPGITQQMAQLRQLMEGLGQLCTPQARQMYSDETVNALLQLSAGLQQINQTGQELANLPLPNASDMQVPDPTAGTDGAAPPVMVDPLTALQRGVDAINTGAGQLAQGAGQLAQGTSQFKDQAPQLADGIKQAATASTQLSDGSRRLNQVAGALAGANGQIADGAGQLAQGTQKAAAGAGALSENLAKAAQGGKELADGSERLRSELAKGSGRIPAFNESQEENIGKTIGSPVDVQITRLNAVANNGAGFTPFFCSLAMWVGGIAIYLVFPALDRRRSKDEAWWSCLLRSGWVSIAMALGQALLVAVGVGLLVELPAGRWLPFYGMLALTSIAFVAINQALIALLSFRGRFFSVLLLVLQLCATGATFPIETTPRFLQVISPWLPMTHTASALRTIIAGQGLPIWPAIVILLVTTFGSVLVTTCSAWATRGKMNPVGHDPNANFTPSDWRQSWVHHLAPSSILN